MRAHAFFLRFFSIGIHHRTVAKAVLTIIPCDEQKDLFYFQLLVFHPGGGNGNTLQYFCLQNPMDRGAWSGCSPWGRKTLDTTEQLILYYCFFIGFLKLKLFQRALSIRRSQYIALCHLCLSNPALETGLWDSGARLATHPQAYGALSHPGPGEQS